MEDKIVIKDPIGTISEIGISEHEDGIWFETSKEEYVVLPKDKAVEMVNKLQKYIFD